LINLNKINNTTNYFLYFQNPNLAPYPLQRVKHQQSWNSSLVPERLV